MKPNLKHTRLVGIFTEMTTRFLSNDLERQRRQLVAPIADAKNPLPGHVLCDVPHELNRQQEEEAQA